MQGTYQSRAEGIIESAKAEYYAAVEAGEDSESAKQRIYSSYIGPLSALMVECDAAVEGVFAQMTSELNAIGASTASVDQLRAVYGAIVSGYSAGLQ